ncbi:CBS domain-containing protein [Halocatena pleomorpha]|uniref:Zinc metalloprotease n=1 Tax=Halocatena pleomorpha TaxID=1785090 RepID=A0A3P3RC73_9EURY|nr:CBS domain-containing protein [Halocatena pleomorpha]RRJ30073.1 CBS domain-containing protein [Halocatena pleomorpha]
MRGIRVGSVFTIPIRLNWTFLIVLPLFAAFIAWDIAQLVQLLNQVFATTITARQLTTGLMPWALGFASAIGLFAGVLLHELGHSIVAMRYGYEIESITLWLLGGVANFAEFPEDWRHELLIAVAGPIVSIGLGVGSYVLFLTTPVSLEAVRFVFGYLAVLNVVLAVFNLLPGFPMDGGRILRALLARNQPHAQATQQAAEVGKFFAFLLGIIGVFTNWFLILLAFFIYIAASGEAQQTSIKASFEGITVRDVMTPEENLKTVSADTSVAELMDRMFEDGHIGYPVVRDEELVGVITLGDAADIRAVEQDAYRVREVMSSPVETIDPSADAMEAFERIQEHDVGRLPVVDADEQLVGIISRTDLLRAFNVIQTGGRPPTIRRPDSGEEFA